MSDHTQKNQQWQKEIAALWPAIKGSLARVYKPCIRKHCPACARGDKHPAWMLSFTLQKRRRVMYVPVALVPLLRQALRNGRKVEKLLYRAGPELVKTHRQLAKSTRRSPAKS